MVIEGVHKVLHTFKILITQKPHMVEPLIFDSELYHHKVFLLFFTGYIIVKVSTNKSFLIKDKGVSLQQIKKNVDRSTKSTMCSLVQ